MHLVLTAFSYRDGHLRDGVPAEQLPTLLADPSCLLWLDVQDPDAAALHLLERTFRFHPLALEDVAKRGQRPKVDQYDGYEFLVLYEFRRDAAGRDLAFTQIGIFMGTNYLVTTHHGPALALSELGERWRQHPSMVEPHPLGFLLYHVADGLVDGYFPVVDGLQQELDDLEEELFDQPGAATLQRLLRQRKRLIALRRIVGEERDVFNVLIRRDHPVFQEATAAFFNDVYDHLLRLAETLDMFRDILTDTLDAYLSQQSNRLNVVVKRLTALTLVLMVVTLVTGFCGMNVGFPGRDEPLGLFLGLASMALLAAAALAVARWQEWL